MGDFTYVHLAWFFDREIASQVLSELERNGIRAVSASSTGTISVYVLESSEADGLGILQSNPDWMAARVKGITGFRAMVDETTDEDAAGESDDPPEEFDPLGLEF